MDFSLTFNGLTLIPANGYTVNMLQGAYGLPIRVSEAPLTGRHGGNIFNRLYDMRIIGFEVTVAGSDSDDFFTKLDALVDAFSIVDETDLTITRWDSTGSTKRIPARVILSPQPLQKGGQAQFTKVRIELKSDDPFFLDVDSTDYVIALAQGGGIPLAAALKNAVAIGATSGDTVVVVNDGQISRVPSIKIAGPVVNPRITNLTTGESFVLTTTIVAGEFVRVYFTQQGFFVLLNDVTNYYSVFDGTVPTVQPGNNTFRFTSSSYNSNALATITHTNAYLHL